MADTRQFPLRITNKQHRWINLLSKVRGVSMNEVVTRAIDNEAERIRKEEPSVITEMRRIIADETSLTSEATGIELGVPAQTGKTAARSKAVPKKRTRKKTT